MTAILKTENISWNRDNNEILQDISVVFEQGVSYGIIGPNGAGKTSLLKCLQGLNSPDGGRVLLRGECLSDKSAKEIAQHIAWLPQVFATPIELSVEDMLRMGLTPHKSWFQTDTEADKQRIEAAIAQCGLHRIRCRAFSHLSGGEQQRVLLARALVQQAEILLLDELTSHLDVYYQHQLLSLVRGLQKTVIMTIHDMNLAAQYLERLVLIKDGQIIAVGSPLEVLRAPLLQETFGLNCDVSVTSNNLPIVCFSHES